MVAKELAGLFYIPVIVDGDIEKEAMSKYGVRGYPTVKFVSAQGESFGELRDRSASGVVAQAKAAAAKIKPRLTKNYVKIVKSMAKLDKALKKNNYRNALKAIVAVEATEHKGTDYKRAQREKSKIQKIAAEQLAEAKGLIESKPSKAKNLLKSIKKTFEGLEEAVEAEKLIKEMDAATKNG